MKGINKIILNNTYVRQRSLQKHLFRQLNRNYSIQKNNKYYTKSFHSSSTRNEAVKDDIYYFFKTEVACQGKNNKCQFKSQLNNETEMEEDNKENYIKDSGICPDSCGEDSYFIVKKKENESTICAVADGVGGWNHYGVDPSKMSRRLMFYANKFALTSMNNSISTHDILDNAYKNILKDKSVDAGSTTACIIQLKNISHRREQTNIQIKNLQLVEKSIEQNQHDNKNHSINLCPFIEYTNLGDSGFIIIRNGDVVFRSKFQTYNRNAPYQLAKIPPRFKNHGNIETKVEEAMNGLVAVKEGDIIVLATDGVWDNFSKDLDGLPPSPGLPRNYRNGEIESLKKIIEIGGSNMAKNIVMAALRNGLKPDDITVIVAVVEKSLENQKTVSNCKNV